MVAVSAPVTGGVHGWAFGRPLWDLGEAGYVEEERFLEGEASTFRAVGEHGRDGHWDATPAGAVPFRTRVLVHRPADPARFNGTAVVCWNNVTAGYDLFAGDTPELLDGYAFVGVTVQRVGVHGLPHLDQGLRAWDPERYGSLSIPTDDASYDIFTQAAEAVRSGEVLGPGFDVRNVVAVGASQSAGRLATYVNAIQPLSGAFDAFRLDIYFGSGSPLEVGEQVVNIMQPAAGFDASSALRGRNLLRDDLDAKVMVVNSELEAMACLPVRQPDTDRFVYWESAGTCHVSEQSLVVRGERYEREFGTRPPIPPGINRIPILPLYDAALRHLRTWLDDGVTPPSQPRISFDESGTVVRDEHGIATGGIRLPQAAVPIASNSARPRTPDIFGILYGSCEPFAAELVRTLYGDRRTYLDRFEEAALACVASGALNERDVEPLVREAAEDCPI